MPRHAAEQRAFVRPAAATQAARARTGHVAGVKPKGTPIGRPAPS
jgi:hypothetical protein